jgi:hypothetical protein
VTDCFYHDIGATPASTSVDLRNDSGVIAHENTFSSAEQNGPIHLLESTRNGDDPGTESPFCEPHKHQADGAEAHHHDSVTRLQVTFMKTAQNASERFYEGSVFVCELVGYGVRVSSNYAFWQTHELSIGSVIEQKIFAEVLLIVAAEEASIAGSGIRGYDTLCYAELCDALADGDNVASHLMTKERRRDNHLRVITATKHFYVGTTREGGADADEQFPKADRRDGYALKPYIFLSIENGRLHAMCHHTVSCG